MCRNYVTSSLLSELNALRLPFCRWPYRQIMRDEKRKLEKMKSGERLAPKAARSANIPPHVATNCNAQPLRSQIPFPSHASAFTNLMHRDDSQHGCARLSSSEGDQDHSRGMPKPCSKPSGAVPEPKSTAMDTFADLNPLPPVMSHSKVEPPSSTIDLLKEVLSRAQERVQGPAIHAFLTEQIAAIGAATNPVGPSAKGEMFPSSLLNIPPDMDIKDTIAHLLKFSLSYRVQVAWQQQQLEAATSKLPSCPNLRAEISKALNDHKKSTFQDIGALEQAAVQLYAVALENKQKADEDAAAASAALAQQQPQTPLDLPETKVSLLQQLMALQAASQKQYEPSAISAPARNASLGNSWDSNIAPKASATAAQPQQANGSGFQAWHTAASGAAAGSGLMGLLAGMTGPNK